VRTIANPTSLDLPANANLGDVVQIAAVGTGAWNALETEPIWTLMGAPVAQWISVASSAEGNQLVAVASAGGIYTSTNAGTN
jgi:hypothetical protein